MFSDYVVSEFGDKYCFRWTGLDEEDPQTRWDKDKTTLTLNEARKSQGMEEVDGDWGNAPLNPALISVWQAEQQANQEDYGQPGAGGAPQAGEPGQPEPEAAEPGGDQPDDQGDDNGAAMQKSFGLPVFTVVP